MPDVNTGSLQVPSYFNWNYTMPSLGPNGELTGGYDPMQDKADPSKGTDIYWGNGEWQHMDPHLDRNGQYISPTIFMSDSLPGGHAAAFPDTDEYAHIGRVFRTDRNRAIGKILALVGGGALAGNMMGAGTAAEGAEGFGTGTSSITDSFFGSVAPEASGLGTELGGFGGVAGSGAAAAGTEAAGYASSLGGLGTELGGFGGVAGSGAAAIGSEAAGYAAVPGGAMGGASGGGFLSKLGDWGKGLVTDSSGSFDINKGLNLASTLAPLFGNNTSSQTTTRNIPAWLDAASQGAVGLGARIATRPYTPYTGQRVAPLDPNEQQAYDLARTEGGSFNQDLQTARDYATKAAQPFTSFDVNAYMNPYIKGALDPAARELRLEAQQQVNAAGQQAAMSNAFGGSRGALLESEARRSGTQAISDLYQKGYAQAFTNAQDQINTDRQRAAAASEQFRALGAQGQTQLMQRLQSLMSTGGMNRAVNQANADFDYQQFIENRDWDVTNLGPLLASLNVPAGGSTTSSAEKSTLQTLAGVGLTLAGMAGGGGSSSSNTTGNAPTIGMKKPMIDTSYPSLWGMEPIGNANDVSSFRRMAATTAFQPALSESY